jgi:regulator of ribonuclease activity B
MGEWDSRAAAEGLVEDLSADGWDLTLARHVTLDVSAPTKEDAEAAARDLRKAGYAVEEEGYDADRERWDVRAREGWEMFVTADSLVDAVDRVEAIVGRRGSLRGFGVEARAEDRFSE